MYFYQLIVSSAGEQGTGEKLKTVTCSQEQNVRCCPYSPRDVHLVVTGEQYLIIITVKIYLFFICSCPSTFMVLYVTKLSFNVQKERWKKTPKTSDYFKPKAALCFYICVFKLWGCFDLVLRNFCFAFITHSLSFFWTLLWVCTKKPGQHHLCGSLLSLGRKVRAEDSARGCVGHRITLIWAQKARWWTRRQKPETCSIV